MIKTITDKGKFAGGYFVLNRQAKVASYTEGDGFSVTCKNTKGLLNSILKMLSEAKEYVKICSFIIDNKQVVDALKEHLKKGIISIFILTAIDDRDIKSDMLEEDERNDLSNSRHFEFIDELVKAGAHVRASSNAHAKFIIKDANKALLMSANLTEPSLNANERGRDPNDESGIDIDDQNEIIILEKLFDCIFLYGTEFRKFININDRTQLISKNDNEIRLTDFPTPSNIIWSYEDLYHTIYQKLNEAIANAKTSIKLSSWVIAELSNLPELVENLERFIKSRHGSVKVFCRAMNFRSDHLKACKQLAEIGAEVFGDMYNHSKGLSVDDESGLIFTANIDGRHGLKSGFEVAFNINKTNSAYTSFNLFLDYQIQSAPYVFVLTPNKSEVFDFYKAWYKERETRISKLLPEILEIKLRSNSIYAQEFEDGISNHPIFYTPLTRLGKNEVQFEMNDRAYLVDILNESTLLVKQQIKRTDVVKAEKYMLFYSKLNLTYYES